MITAIWIKLALNWRKVRGTLKLACQTKLARPKNRLNIYKNVEVENSNQ